MPFLKAVFGICAATLVGLSLFSYLFLLKNIRMPRMELIGDPGQLGFPYETVTLRTEDGLRLAAWWILIEPSRPTIVLMHGLGTNRSDVLSIADFLGRAKFNLLMFDLRAHGESEGEVTSYGWLEQKDVKAAIDYLDQLRGLSNHTYGIFAPSMSGAAAILHAARDDRIQAIVVDSVYADLAGTMAGHLKLLWGFPPVLFGWFAHRAYELRFLTPIHTVSPKRWIAQIAPRAVLIIAGELDERMPPREARKLYEAAQEPKELWIIPGADHFGGLAIVPEEYKNRITSFFNNRLHR